MGSCSFGFSSKALKIQLSQCLHLRSFLKKKKPKTLTCTHTHIRIRFWNDFILFLKKMVFLFLVLFLLVILVFIAFFKIYFLFLCVSVFLPSCYRFFLFGFFFVKDRVALGLKDAVEINFIITLSTEVC